MALNYYYVGKRIKDIRTKQRLSQATLSEMVDKTPTYISYIENGVKSMSLETLVAIANALQVSVDMLLGETIKNPIRVDVSEFTEILKDCSAYERRVVLDAARSVKKSMREYRFLLTIIKQ